MATLNLFAWYGAPALVVTVLMVGVALYAFHTASAGQPLFGAGLLETDD